jgi:hypothetical protein
VVASLRIDVGASVGTPGESRNDGEPGVLVTVTALSVGATTRTLRFANIEPHSDSSPALAHPTSTTWTFTPPADAYGRAYLLELVEDEGRETASTVRRTLRIPTENLGLLMPAPMETANPLASRQNNGPTVVAASNDNAGGNYLGWSDHLSTWLRTIDDQLGRLRLTGAPDDGLILVPTTIADGQLLRRSGTNIVGTFGVQSVQNVGGGSGVWLDTVNGVVSLRSIVGVGDITVTQNADTVSIEYTGTPGDITGAANVGGGAAVYHSEVGGVLNFRTIITGTPADISITQNANTISISYIGGGGGGGGAGEPDPGTDSETWIINQDAAVGAADPEHACAVWLATDGTGLTDSLFRGEMCLIAGAGVTTGTNAYFEIYVQDDGAHHNTEVHIGKRGDATVRRAVLVFHAAGVSGARTCNITLENGSANELEFNGMARVKLNTRVSVRLNNNLEVEGTGSFAVGLTSPENRIHVKDSAANSTALMRLDKSVDQDSALRFMAGVTPESWTVGFDRTAALGFVMGNAAVLGSVDRFGIESSSGIVRVRSDLPGAILAADADGRGNFQTKKTQLVGNQDQAVIWSYALRAQEAVGCLFLVVITSTTDSGFYLVAHGARSDDGVTAELLGPVGTTLHEHLDAQLVSHGVTIDMTVIAEELVIRATQTDGTYNYEVFTIWGDNIGG